MEPALNRGMEREPPMLRYRSPDPETPAAERTPPPAGTRALQILSRGILGLCLAVWAIVGLVFWIPLLVRAMVRFSVTLVQATMDGEHPTEAARTLRDAISFYRRGFVMTIDAVNGRDPEESDRRKQTRVTGSRMLREIAWAAVIWYVIFVPLGWAWSPVELWGWITAWPWNNWLEHTADSFWALIYG